MSTDRHQPLDADERELARVLRALPAGEPPSSLDAKILAMARDAVVTTPSQKDEAQPRRCRAPRVVWGLGVAASCVMAAGLVWRMGGFGAESLDVVGTAVNQDVAESAAAAEPEIQPAPPMPEAQDEHIAVQIGVPPSKPAPTIAPPPPPPPPPPEPPARRAPAAALASAPPAPPAPAAPAAAPPPVDARPQADLARLRLQAVESRRESVESEADAVAEAFAAAPAPAPESAVDAAPSPQASAEANDAAGNQALDRVTVTGSRIQDVRIEHEDGSAGAQTWIQRIRARIARGDEDGARTSLEAFIERHPRKPLPQDLIDFGARAGIDGMPRDDG